MSRDCVFCGGTPLSNEHAWPDWLQEELRTPGAVVSMRWGATAPFTRVDQKDLEIKVKRVCAPCNNNWMSRLESVKDVLLPVIRGQVQQIPDAEHQLVATWAVKTVMMLQFTPTVRAGQVIHESLYHELFGQQDRLPATVAVWTGYEADEPPPGAGFGLRGMAIGRVDRLQPTPTMEYHLGFEATMIVRRLVLKVMGHAGPPELRTLDEVVAPPSLDLIWPRAGVTAQPSASNPAVLTDDVTIQLTEGEAPAISSRLYCLADLVDAGSPGSLTELQLQLLIDPLPGSAPDPRPSRKRM